MTLHHYKSKYLFGSPNSPECVMESDNINECSEFNAGTGAMTIIIILWAASIDVNCPRDRNRKRASIPMDEQCRVMNPFAQGQIFCARHASTSCLSL